MYFYFKFSLFSRFLCFAKTRFFRIIDSFTKLRNSRNSSLIFDKHENRFVASFARFLRNESSSKTLCYMRVGRVSVQDWTVCRSNRGLDF